MWLDFKNEAFTITSNSKSQLEIYLEMPLLDIMFRNMNVLEWWNDQYKRFPNLFLMACNLLSVPIRIITLESTFSIRGQVLNEYRSHFLLKKV